MDKFRDLLTIFKSVPVPKEDAGLHMAQFCKDSCVVSQPRWSLISSYFGHQLMIPISLLCWYLVNGLVVMCLYLLMQYDEYRCFQFLGKACAQKWPDAQQDPSQALSRELAKLLLTSVYGKCREKKTRFILRKRPDGQQGHGLQLFQGHETFAGHASA